VTAQPPPPADDIARASASPHEADGTAVGQTLPVDQAVPLDQAGPAGAEGVRGNARSGEGNGREANASHRIKPDKGLKPPHDRPKHWGYPMLGRPWHPTHDYAPGNVPPLDVIDNRPYGQWRSRYPQELHPLIRNEAIYLTLSAVGCLVLAWAAWVQLHGAFDRYQGNWAAVWRLTAKPALSFAAGGLGGTLFGYKWLYHAVAKGMWHLDRRLWRIFTPVISAILAASFVALVSADVFRLLNKDVVQTLPGLYGVSFLVGYFSDITIGKLNEVAQVLLGQQVDRRTQPDRSAEARRAVSSVPSASAPSAVPAAGVPAAGASPAGAAGDEASDDGGATTRAKGASVG
jgi:hypothetical protein